MPLEIDNHIYPVPPREEEMDLPTHKMSPFSIELCDLIYSPFLKNEIGRVHKNNLGVELSSHTSFDQRGLSGDLS